MNILGTECFAKLINQSQSLIRLGIWEGVRIDDLLTWRKNFTTDTEKIFAAYVLDHLVYRNVQHMTAMLYDVLTRHLHNEWRLDHNLLYSESKNPLDILQQKYGPLSIRYMGAVKSEWSQTKSGYRIIHHLNHQLAINAKWNTKIDNISRDYLSCVRTFLIFDDIICTGEQMCEVLAEIDYNSVADAKFYVCVCAAHEQGIYRIKEEFPWVRIIYAEKLLNNTTIFDFVQTKTLGLDDTITLNDWYESFLEKINYRGDKYGKGNLAMLYAFQEGVPNNSLPILYHNNDQFKLLLRKRG